MKIKLYTLMGIIFLILYAAIQNGLIKDISLESFFSKNPNKNFEMAVVSRHIDGDTVYVKFQDGREDKLRFIGVNTPETRHPKKGVEYYGKEASEYTKQKLLKRTIYLEKDISERDKYGRLLRYIWLEVPKDLTEDEISTKMFNAIIVKEGYAQVYTFPPDVKYQDQFLKLQREARENKRGLWTSRRHS